MHEHLQAGLDAAHAWRRAKRIKAVVLALFVLSLVSAVFAEGLIVAPRADYAARTP